MARGTTGDIAAVIRDLVGHTSTTVTDALVLEAINTAIEEAQLTADWQPHDQTWEATYPVNADGLALPEGIVFVYQWYQRDTTQTDPSRALVPLDETTRYQWQQRAIAGDASRVHPRPAVSGTYYYLWDGKVFVVPQPSTAIELVLDYRGWIRPLTTVATAPSPESQNYFTLQYQRTITWGALAIIWHALGEDGFETNADARAMRLLQRAVKHDAVLKSSGPPKVRGT